MNGEKTPSGLVREIHGAAGVVGHDGLRKKRAPHAPGIGGNAQRPSCDASSGLARCPIHASRAKSPASCRGVRDDRSRGRQVAHNRPHLPSGPARNGKCVSLRASAVRYVWRFDGFIRSDNPQPTAPAVAIRGNSIAPPSDQLIALRCRPPRRGSVERRITTEAWHRRTCRYGNTDSADQSDSGSLLAR
jgi:hypothetical protein